MSIDSKSDYYDVGGIETIDYVAAKLTADESRGYLKGCIIKYVSRMGHKPGAERDAEKLAVYARLLAEVGG